MIFRLDLYETVKLKHIKMQLTYRIIYTPAPFAFSNMKNTVISCSTKGVPDVSCGLN